MEQSSSDVLIIGGGLAAACAAIESAQYGVSVTLVDKGILGSSGSTPTSGGDPQVYFPDEVGGHPEDSLNIMYEDIVKGGEYLSNQTVAREIVWNATRRISEADSFGVPYCKHPDGKYKTYISLGMSYARVGPVERHGAGLMQALRKEVLHRGVKVIEGVMITRILTGENRTVGACGFSTRTGEFYSFEAKSTILATGGASGMYPFRSANYSTTGDSYALTYDLGLPLMNMEFTEFTIVPSPRGIPFSTGGIKPTLAEGAIIVNGKGNRIMEKYDPVRMENTTRSNLVRAVYLETAEGRGPVYLDARTLTKPTRPLERVGEAFGINYRKEKIPYAPAIHSNLGGVVIDTDCRTGLEGLYAAGETCGHGGAFGADRACGAIAACHVHGHQAGRNAALDALNRPAKNNSLSQAQLNDEKVKLEKLGQTGGAAPCEIEKQLLNACNWHMGVVRNQKGLQEGLAELERLSAVPMNVTYPHDLVKALEVKNLLLTARLVGQAALERKESRGQQQRDDYPDTDNKNWLKWIILCKNNKSTDLTTTPVPIQDYPLQPNLKKDGGEAVAP